MEFKRIEKVIIKNKIKKNRERKRGMRVGEEGGNRRIKGLERKKDIGDIEEKIIMITRSNKRKKQKIHFFYAQSYCKQKYNRIKVVMAF